MSDAVMISIVTGVFGLFNGLLAIGMVIVNSKLNKIHVLTNSNYGLQLRLNAKNSRWRAEASGKPADEQAADQAETLLKQHEDSQAAADKK